MKIALSWLADFVSVDLPLEEIIRQLTNTGLSVEAVETKGVDHPGVVVARIESFEPHPNADRLSVCQVGDGSGELRQIVCGAKNFRAGDRVPLALPGTVLPGNFKIKTGRLRGVESQGMMCSGRELGLSEDAAGLLILPEGAPVGSPLSEVFPPDTVLELEITPNRPDWLSHLGVARELAAFLDCPLTAKLPASPVTKEDEGVAVIRAGSGCGFYSLRKISGVRVGPSPDWMAERLRKIGLRPINNVVDVTNYVLHELGQPLHAFDAAKVSGGIVVRGAEEGETFHSLEERDFSLAKGETVIADAKGVLALGGVMGGLESGVTTGTVDVLLESAWFEPGQVRRTARRNQLQTDSSYRFERGVDPEMNLRASARATELIVELAGGRADEQVVVCGMLPERGAPVELRHDRCNRLLDLQLEDGRIEDSLERLALEKVSAGEGRSTWRPPSFRLDLLREVDLIEEIARLVGIEAVPSRIAGSPAPLLPSDHEYDFVSHLRSRLTALGFHEARLSTLVPGSQLFGLEETAVRIRNPLGEDQSWLRSSLLPGLLGCAGRNFHQGSRNLRIFEVGSVFQSEEPGQQSALALLATGKLWSSDWRGQGSADFEFFDLAGILGSLFALRLEMEPVSHPELVVAAELRLRKKVVGIAGLLPPAKARAMDAPGEISMVEIFLAPLMEAVGNKPPEWKPVPKFPSVVRDLALVLDEVVSYREVARVLREHGGALLIQFLPFDVFRDPSGEKLPKGKKSLAVSLTFQSSEKTLDSSEIDKEVARIQLELSNRVNAEFRG